MYRNQNAFSQQQLMTQGQLNMVGGAYLTSNNTQSLTNLASKDGARPQRKPSRAKTATKSRGLQASDSL